MPDDTSLEVDIELQENETHVKNPYKHQVWWKHFVAGAIAGIFSRTLTAPLDRIKIYAQVSGKKVSVLNGIKYMIKEGGFFSMWRGNGVNLIKVAPETATKFLVYEQLKRWMQKKDHETKKLQVEQRFLAGALAGAMAQTIVYPIDVIKTRRVLSRSIQKRSIIEIARKGYETHGITFFCKGYLCNILGIFLFTGIDLAIYETMKKKCFFVTDGDRSYRDVCVLSSAATACAVAQMMTYPLSMMGTTIQAEDTKFGNQLEVCMSSMRQRMNRLGIVGLYRGSGPALAKALPALCSTYYIYETVLRTLGTHMT